MLATLFGGSGSKEATQELGGCVCVCYGDRPALTALSCRPKDGLCKRMRLTPLPNGRSQTHVCLYV